MNEYDMVSQAYAIIDMHKELMDLIRENEELKEKIKTLKDQVDESFQSSKDIHNAWFGGVLEGKIKVRE